ncbi:hypothetical protein HUG17_8626 [Dermatophagoides farinae]|uniref:Uncharacterized protein n=1 Tax=Dermatophagoides farinae TaxID=6954 RepID=A0A9D4SCV9_DERFA|nr:uncharacterized protein LOC124496598 [Dermatophagoides farinae]KAH7637522.1 hypothetical protein HUG17_8626 [Dermatophagoides farinae]
MKFLINISCYLLLLVAINSHVYAAPSSTPEDQSQPKQQQQPAAAASAAEIIPDEKLAGKNDDKNDQDASSAAIRIPVDNANKLLYDLDAQVRQLFDESSLLPIKEEKSEDDGGETAVAVDDVQSYSAANRELDIYPRQTETNAQQASLTIQLENLEKRLLSTINELQTRRRYFSSTMLRQMYNSVHRIRVNISRIQNQFSVAQPSQSSGSSGGGRPGQSGMMQNLQQRVTDLQKAVNDIINRVTSTFQGPNAPKPTGHHHQALQAVNF